MIVSSVDEVGRPDAFKDPPGPPLGILKEYDSVLGTNRIEKLLFVRKFYLRLLNRESTSLKGY